MQHVVPTSAPITVPPASNQLLFTILPDPFTLKETSWTLTKLSPGNPTIIQRSPSLVYKYIDPNFLHYTEVNNLAIGNYQFSLFDQGGNGLLPPAYYIVTLNGVVLKTGGSFLDVVTVYFNVTTPPTGTLTVINYNGTAPTSVVPAPKPATKVQKPKKKPA